MDDINKIDNAEKTLEEIEKTQKELEELEIKPVDSTLKVEIQSGGISARVYVYPPKNDGLEITKAKIMEELANSGVVFGINEPVISFIEISKKYNEWITVAECLPAENGENGTIEFLFSNENAGLPKEDARGYVDFKNLGTVRNILKGTVIANITKETQGKAGTSIRNEPINQKPGVPAKVTFGENIELSPDGLTIVASVDGNLAFSSGRFCIQTTLKIDGDVDVSTGNIDFIGDVVVRGDVREGFSVNAGKNIKVDGGCFASKLTASGTILIRNGAIGSVINAEKSVEMDFAENSTITCSELLKSHSIYYCEVYCKGEINVTLGTGSIVGGRVIATKNLYANHIGSKNYTPTMIIIGDNAIMSQEKERLATQVARLIGDEQKCLQIVEFLKEKQIELGSLPNDKLDIMNSALKTVLISRREQETCNKRIEEIDIYLQNKQNLFINCKKELNPGVKITINDEVLFVKQLYQYCQIGLGNDGIEIRTL